MTQPAYPLPALRIEVEYGDANPTIPARVVVEFAAEPTAEDVTELVDQLTALPIVAASAQREAEAPTDLETTLASGPAAPLTAIPAAGPPPRFGLQINTRPIRDNPQA